MPTLTLGGGRINHLKPMNKLSIPDNQPSQDSAEQSESPQVEPQSMENPSHPYLDFRGGTARYKGGMNRK